MRRTLRTFDTSPAWSLWKGRAVGFDGSLTQGFRLDPLDGTCSTDEVLEQRSESLARILTTVPEGTTLRFYVSGLRGGGPALTRYQEALCQHPTGKQLCESRLKDLDGNLERVFELYVSTPQSAHFLPHQGPASIRWDSLIRDISCRFEEQGVALNQTSQSLRSELQACGIGLQPYNTEEHFAALWRLANPTQVPDPKRRFNPEASMRAQLFGANVRHFEQGFSQNGMLHRVQVMRLLPRSVVPMQLMPLSLLNFPYTTVVTLRRISGLNARRRLERTRSTAFELEQAIRKFRGNARHEAMPDAGVLSKRDDGNDALARLSQGESLFEMAVQVSFFGKTWAELDQKSDMLRARFVDMDAAESSDEELRSWVAFQSMLPGHHSLIEDRYHGVLSSRAADFLPVYGPPRGSDEPTTLLTSSCGSLVGFDPFDRSLPSWNGTIVGSSGSGKSFIARILLAGWLSQGGRAIVVTRGGDYARFAEAFDGTYQTINPADPDLGLSPFPSQDFDADRLKIALSGLNACLAAMISEGKETLSRDVQRLISRTSDALYAQVLEDGSEPSFDTWLACLKSLDDPAGVAPKIESGIRFWLEGDLGDAFRRPFPRNSAEGSPKFGVWDLSLVPEGDSLAVIFGTLAQEIGESIDAGPTVVVLDEVWSVLRSAEGARLVETLYRTVRKLGSSIWTIPQSISDYLQLPTDLRSAILNNSPIKIFLSHDASDASLVSEVFKLNERETELLQGLRMVPGSHSEMLGFFGDRRSKLRLEPSPMEYWLSTSHPKDLAWEKVYRSFRPDASALEMISVLSRRMPKGGIHVAGL